jgi:hypothetical protein
LLNNVVYGGSVTNAAISGTTTITGATITGGTVSGLTTDLAIADGGTGASTALAAFDALKQAATATYVGAVELATDAEVITGTDITRAMTPASFRAGNIVSGTAVVSTSGTSIDFTSIPSWAKRITVMFSGVSLSGSSSILVQIGSATLETTGYISQASLMSTAVTSTSSTAGFIVDPGSSATLMYGVLDIYLLDVTTNTWVERHTLGRSTPGSSVGGGTKALSGTLQRLRITTVNGTDTFDAGTVNIMWE